MQRGPVGKLRPNPAHGFNERRALGQLAAAFGGVLAFEDRQGDELHPQGRGSAIGRYEQFAEERAAGQLLHRQRPVRVRGLQRAEAFGEFVERHRWAFQQGRVKYRKHRSDAFDRAQALLKLGE